MFLFSSCQKDIKSELAFSDELFFPDWYGKLTFNSDEVIGYGNGKTENEAREMAIRNISEQLKVSVKTSTESTKERQNNLIINDKFSTSSQIESSTELLGLEVLRRTFDGKFIALKYRKADFETKFIEKLKPENYQCNKNLYVENTVLYKRAVNLKKCLPKISFFKKDGNIFINADSTSEIIESFSILFFDKKANNLEIVAPKTIKEYDKFDININLKTAGFLNLLLINENGEVFEIVSNLYLETANNISVNTIIERELCGAIENNKTFERAMFVAILSKNNLESNFLKIRQNQEKYSELKFENMLQLFDDSIDFEFTSATLTIY